MTHQRTTKWGGWSNDFLFKCQFDENGRESFSFFIILALLLIINIINILIILILKEMDVLRVSSM